MKKTILISCIILAFVLLTGCADAQNNLDSCMEGHTCGFFAGLWHGIIAPFTFLGSLFDNTITVWAPNNNGGWYAFGFILGGGSSIITFGKEVL